MVNHVGDVIGVILVKTLLMVVNRAVNVAIVIGVQTKQICRKLKNNRYYFY